MAMKIPHLSVRAATGLAVAGLRLEKQQDLVMLIIFNSEVSNNNYRSIVHGSAEVLTAGY